jgi:hypothetical protein
MATRTISEANVTFLSRLAKVDGEMKTSSFTPFAALFVRLRPEISVN